MNPSHEPAGTPATVCCVLAGWAATRFPVEAMGELRKQPGPPCGKPVAANFLKHADEQTVAGVTAAFQAIKEHSLAPEGTPAVFRDWGVIAAPRATSADPPWRPICRGSSPRGPGTSRPT